MPLRLRLALFGAAVVALTLVLFGALLYALLAHGATTNQDDALRSRAREAAASLNSGSDLAPRAPVAAANLATSSDVFVDVLDQSWTVIYTTGELNGTAPAIAPGLRARAAGGAFDTEGGLRLYAIPFKGGYVVTGQSTRVVQSNLSGIVGFLVISGVPTLIAALAASWLVAGRALKPLKDVAGTADEIGRTRDFARRLPRRRTRDEVAMLSTSFNRMLEQLQDSFESQRRFVADASHELRTPLTTIQGNAGLLARGPEVSDEDRRAAAADISAETSRMTRLVDRMLTLARADSGLKLGLAPLELAPVVLEVCRQAQTVHPDRDLVTDANSATIAGDEDAIRQLVWILLDNALRHSRSRVSVILSTEGDWTRLTVADDGPGIDAAEREKVFERFYRSDRARSGQGAGLGLSIARWIVEQHGGRILAGEGQEGGGAAMYVDIPAVLPGS
ncbi:MAG TPA: HAMP domain-containing sensor histidine kinase [Candidatus Acidoferrum sp.]|nr:HAMP domain-containing sensor histidine kinase [Candidatus Acidoferrum sp.]